MYDQFKLKLMLKNMCVYALHLAQKVFKQAAKDYDP